MPIADVNLATNRRTFVRPRIDPRTPLGCASPVLHPYYPTDRNRLRRSAWRNRGAATLGSWPASRVYMEGAMTSDFVDSDGFQLEWHRAGMGIPMLIIGGAHFYPQYFPEAMRDHFDMVFCDSRHWVTTPKGFDLSTLTLDMIADDYERIRVAAGLERPIVVGQSQHAYHALVYARRHPDRVRGVVLVAPRPPSDNPDEGEFFERDASPERKAQDARIRAAVPAPDQPVTSADFIDRYVANSAYFWFDPSVDRRYLWEGTVANIPVFDRMWDDDMLGGFRLEPSDIPTFLALGRYDYSAPYHEWDPFRPLFSNLTYRLYERSAHQPPFEQPDEFTADMVEWARTLV